MTSPQLLLASDPGVRFLMCATKVIRDICKTRTRFGFECGTLIAMATAQLFALLVEITMMTTRLRQKREMTMQQEGKGQQPKRKQSSQSSLISNYFKRVDPPAEKVRSITTVKHNSPIDPPQSSPQSSDDDGPVQKRPRLTTPPSDSPTPAIPAGEWNVLTALMSPKIKEFRPPPESPRTSRYKFIPSSPAATNDNLTPQELEKRNSLHAKFVQKLGRPDSMATFRQAAQNEALEGDWGADEDEEVEEVPAAKDLRGKYSATRAAQTSARKNPSETASTKLTPLERQYVEIKKQYPDTLLLIEVGYKFRFFGEDAKVFSSIC